MAGEVSDGDTEHGLCDRGDTARLSDADQTPAAVPRLWWSAGLLGIRTPARAGASVARQQLEPT